MRGHWKQGRKRHAVLIQAFGFVGDDGAAPIQLRDRAPGFAMADALFLMRGAVRARLQRLAPAHTGVDERLLVVHARPFGAPGDDGFQFLRAHYGAQAVRRGVVVIIDQHGGADQIFARRADAADARIQMAGFRRAEFLRWRARLCPTHGSASRNSTLSSPM